MSSDFPHEGNAEAVRAWLDNNGFEDYFNDENWNASQLMGLDKEDILNGFELPPRKALKLYGALVTAKEDRARDRGRD